MRDDSVDRMVQEWAARDDRLDASPLHVVGRLFRGADYGRRAVLDALRPFGLTYGDFDVLNTLRRRGDVDGTNPGDLAQAALITSGAMTTRLDRLEQAGYVHRAVDPADRRGVRVRLTRQGEELATAALEAVLVADEQFLAPLSPAERDQIAQLLKRLMLPHEE
ncbi:MarR family transcriptional regulator [Actinomycetes bacterium KLBMP 9759]